MENSGKSQSNDELRDAILRQIDEYALAFYISQTKGETMTPKHGGSYQIGERKGQGSISTFTAPDGVARASDFAENFTNSNIFDWIEHLEGVKDYREKLIRGAEIAGGVTVGSRWDSSFTDEEKAKRREQLEAEKAARRADYEKFKARHMQTLRDGMQSPAFESVCKKRCLDASKIATLENIGFAVDGFTVYLDAYHKANDKKAEKIGIKTGSLVVWDDDGAGVKALELDAETGKRKSEIQLPGGDCHWHPFTKDRIENAGELYLTEGETSAIALVFAMINNGLAVALPCKPNAANADQIAKWAKDKRVYLAYDNDTAGRGYTQKAKQTAPGAVDLSPLWSGDGWGEGSDPNDYTARFSDAGAKISAFIESVERETTRETVEAIERTEAIKRLQTVDDVLQYLKSKNDARSHSECSRRFYADPLFGQFCYGLDPYGIRRFAPVACLVAYGVARLAKYDKRAGGRILTEQRIVNVAGRKGCGKDWILGTAGGSHSLAYQMRREQGFSVSIDNAQPTGNGLARYALEFASKDENKGKAKVILQPESGNALTQGYDSAKRTGSLSSFDIGLSNRRVDVPKTGTALKDFKDFKESYDFDGVCVRAFQDVNAHKVVIPRFAGGGESRRELWFAITHPSNDELCTDENANLFDDVLSFSFDQTECDHAFESIRNAALPFDPVRASFDDDATADGIRIDTNCDAYKAVYLGQLLKTVTNTYFRDDKSALIRSQFAFLSALCAGLHGRYEAQESDYWCAGYIVEVLSRSLDMITGWDVGPENTESLHAQILSYVERAGVSGVRADSVFRKFPDGKRAVDELLSGSDGDGAPIFRMVDGESRKLNAYFFASQYRSEIETGGRFRMPVK